MNYLIITDNQDFVTKTTEEIQSLEKSAKIYNINFSFTEIKKFKSKIEDLTLCILYTENQEQFSLETKIKMSNCCGYAIAKDILILTNIKFLNDSCILSTEYFKFKETQNKLIEYIKQQYEHISITNTKRVAKKKLLEKGIPFTPDCFATYIAKNKSKICDLFINGGMDINSRDENGTPLLNIAVRNDNEDFVKLFIDLGADINSVSQDRGYTPVMDAVWKGNKEIAKILIEEGAELNTINKEGQTNLVLAVGANKTEICKLLAEHGADPDIKDQMGMSAYGYATLFKKEDIINILKPFHKE